MGILMCMHGEVEKVYIDNHHIEIDKCISKLVGILDENGMKTLKSCCGHGEHDGFILGKGFLLIIPIEYSNGKHFDRYDKDFYDMAEYFGNK